MKAEQAPSEGEGLWVAGILTIDRSWGGEEEPRRSRVGERQGERVSSEGATRNRGAGNLGVNSARRV